MPTSSSLSARPDTAVCLAPKRFAQQLQADTTALLLDVRRPEEYAEGHLPQARLIDWLDTEAFKHEAALLPHDRTLYIYCRSGRRSAEAASWLTAQGFRVVDMQGGYLKWNEQGLPTTR